MTIIINKIINKLTINCITKLFMKRTRLDIPKNGG